MDKKREEEIIAQAEMLEFVLAQVPMWTNKEARAAGNMVWEYYRESVCENPEEKDVFDGYFKNYLPLSDATVELYKDQFADLDFVDLKGFPFIHKA